MNGQAHCGTLHLWWCIQEQDILSAQYWGLNCQGLSAFPPLHLKKQEVLISIFRGNLERVQVKFQVSRAVCLIWVLLMICLTHKRFLYSCSDIWYKYSTSQNSLLIFRNWSLSVQKAGHTLLCGTRTSAFHFSFCVFWASQDKNQ